MNLVHLLPVGTIGKSLLESLRDALPHYLPIRCAVLSPALDPAAAYHVERQQFHSSEILQRIHHQISNGCWRVLAVADVDLYIPILKYVFGEAQVGGPCALVSAHRLHQEFYGLARDTELLQQRLLKECVHELGHTFGLHHCQDYRCAMASSHAVEWIDLRGSFLCNECRLQVDASACFLTALQHKISAS
jgi:archaemetzincin